MDAREAHVKMPFISCISGLTFEDFFIVEGNGNEK